MPALPPGLLMRVEWQSVLRLHEGQSTSFLQQSQKPAWRRSQAVEGGRLLSEEPRPDFYGAGTLTASVLWNSAPKPQPHDPGLLSPARVALSGSVSVAEWVGLGQHGSSPSPA